MTIGVIQTTEPSELILDGSKLPNIKISLQIKTQKILKGDVVLAIDCSESMQSIDNNKIKRKKIVGDFIDDLNLIRNEAIDEVSISVIGWDSEVYTLGFTNDRNHILNFVNGSLPKDDIPETNFDLALESAKNELSKSERHDLTNMSRLIIFITDGIRDGKVDTFSDKNGIIDEAIKNGYKIFSIGFNMPEISNKFFLEMATATNGAHFNYQEENLRDFIQKIGKSLEYQLAATNAKLAYILQPYMHKPSNIEPPNATTSIVDGNWMIEWDIGVINAGKERKLTFETGFNPNVPITNKACNRNSELVYQDEMKRTIVIPINSGLALKNPSILRLIRNKIKN